MESKPTKTRSKKSANFSILEFLVFMSGAFLSGVLKWKLQRGYGFEDGFNLSVIGTSAMFVFTSLVILFIKLIFRSEKFNKNTLSFQFWYRTLIISTLAMLGALAYHFLR